MRKYYSLPLVFFFCAATLGLFLRWQFVDPTPGIRFTWFVHSHSHVMFLGWVMNVLYLSCIEYHLPEEGRPGFLKLFWFLQAMVVSMMISFPIQGYGTYSIIFSTVHTLAVMAFIVIFFKRTAKTASVSLWFARIAWFFFFLSTAGPFSLGYLMASGLGQTVWAEFSIYYYLHFQYNGFFLFGILSLFYQVLERKQILFDPKAARQFGSLMAIACIPAYALSVLFAQPGILFNIVGGVAAILQLLALLLFVQQLKKIQRDIRLKFNKTVYNLLRLILLLLICKSILQLLSADPYLAQLAYQLHPVVIAYLHLVLVGVITFSLLAWYMERNLVHRSLAALSTGLLLLGFLVSEACLVMIPWWSNLIGEAVSSPKIIFWFSVLMWLGALLFCVSFFSKHAGAISISNADLLTSQPEGGQSGQAPDKSHFFS